MAEEGHGRAPPAMDEEARRRMIAGFLMHANLAGRRIEGTVDGLTEAQLVDRIARMAAVDILHMLRELYSIEHWDLETFARAFIEGAIGTWKPGAIVHGDKRQLNILSKQCPLADEVALDARVCSMCQAVQTHAARLALRGDVAEASFSTVIAAGDAACQLDIKLRPRGRPA